MKSRAIRLSLLGFLLAGTVAAAPSGGCAVFNGVCGCSGSLGKTVRADGRYVATTTVNCEAPTRVSVYTYHVGYGGREIDLEGDSFPSNPLRAPGAFVPVWRAAVNYFSIPDYFKSVVYLSRDDGRCSSIQFLYNDL